MVPGSVCLLSPEACAVEDGAAFPSLHTVFFTSPIQHFGAVVAAAWGVLC